MFDRVPESCIAYFSTLANSKRKGRCFVVCVFLTLQGCAANSWDPSQTNSRSSRMYNKASVSMGMTPISHHVPAPHDSGAIRISRRHADPPRTWSGAPLPLERRRSAAPCTVGWQEMSVRVQVRGWWRGKGEMREGMRDAEGGRGRTYHWASLPTTSDEVIELGCDAFLQRHVKRRHVSA